MLKEMVQAKTCGLNRELPVIELNGERLLTTELLAQVYNTDIKNISNNFNRNKEKFIEGKHYFLLQGHELKEFKAIHLKDESLKFVSQLYLWTERGANRHCKILDTDKAWEQFDNLEETYFRVKEQKPTCIEDLIIMQAQSMKDLKQQVDKANNHALEAKATAEESKQEIQGIRDIVALSPNQWKEDTAKLINKIANKLGGFEHISPIRKEVYRLLDNTYGVKLNTRLLNKQKKMALEGAPKYKIDKLNKVDVIADDKKLINGYVNIVSKLAIKYGV